jgi:predicted phage tail protein
VIPSPPPPLSNPPLASTALASPTNAQKIRQAVERCRSSRYHPEGGGDQPGELLSCYGFVRYALAEIGRVIPANQAAALEGEKEWATEVKNRGIETGDIVVMNSVVGDDGGPLRHVGICIDPFEVAHFTRQDGMRVDRLGLLRSFDPTFRVLRLRDTPPSPPSLPEPQEPRPRSTRSVNTFRVVSYTDILSRSGRRITDMEIEPGLELPARLVAAKHVGLHACLILNDRVVPSDESPMVRAGDELVVAPSVGETTTWVMVGIAIVSAVASAFLMPRPKLPAATQSDTPADQRFSFGKLASAAFAGDAIQVTLGERIVGGKVVSVVPGEGIDGSGDSRIKMLICLGHGRCVAGDGVDSIGNQTADFDRVPWTALTGIELNDQPIGNFPGCYASGRMGTMTQTPIPGFTDIETAREVGVGGVTLRNSSGSPRTGGSASGEAFTFSTLGPVDAVLVRVSMLRGLYQLSVNGQVEPRSVQYRYRHRATAGPGAWSAWSVVTVSKALQSQFYSTVRIAGLGGVACDIQVERVTAESTDVTVADEMLWESCVEITLATENYAGKAMLALDLTASEQLTGVPRVSVNLRGLGKLRRWDGISDPSSPTFTVGYSNNQADLALEVITNPYWGMGAAYGIEDVDLESYCEFRQKCATLRDRPGGGTRPRFACNLTLDAAKEGVDWLRTICRTARCTPGTNGKTWRFSMDDVRPTAVDEFTDGSIAVDEHGVSVFEYTREFTTHGYVRPTRTIIQFENEQQDFKVDTVAYPVEPGDLWLATEPLVEETVRLDGVTDPDQAATEAKYIMKRTRGLSRSVKFQTTKNFVKSQPQDRFDLAISSAGWGLASGRLRAGATANTVILDRTLALGSSTYGIRVVHLDGSVEAKTITSPGSTVYPAGAAITVNTDFAQVPARGAEYAVGASGLEMKPFTCTAVRMVESETLMWELEGIEYSADVYDDAADEVNVVDYGTLSDLTTPPGPVVDLRAFDRLVGGIRKAQLAWRQTPADAQITAMFRMFRRIVGTQTWIRVSDAKIALNGSLVEIVDVDRAYEFCVVAVSQGGAALSPDDPRVPKVQLVFGLAAPPPEAPTGLAITNTGGNTYEVTWDAVPGAEGYQVLTGGDTTGLPNVGAEDCLVLARTVGPILSGLELPPSQACRFFVRSVGASGRLSWAAATIAISTPATPAGETIKNTTTCNLSGSGTLTNLTWSGSRLELTNPNAVGTWLSPEIDTGAETLTELTMRPQTANDADDPTISSDPFTVPSIGADQWGVITIGPAVVGMVMPPWPDDIQAWVFEVRTKSMGIWSDWAVVPVFSSIRRAFRQYQVRVTMSRRSAPYRPALRGLVVVTTN